MRTVTSPDGVPDFHIRIKQNVFMSVLSQTQIEMFREKVLRFDELLLREFFFSFELRRLFV